MIDRTATSIAGQSTFELAQSTRIAHTQATLRSTIILGAAALLLAGGASAPAATGIGSVVGNDAPSWSPDGKSIVFTSFRNGKGDIYAMDARGTGQRRLTTTPAHDDLPAWSPDGSRIAFTSDRDGNLELYVMNADGSGQTRLTFDPAPDFGATWSPDGKRIAWESARAGNYDVYSMNPDGSDVRPLTTNTASDVMPSWGPDGRVAFISTRDTGAKTSLYVMNPDGTGQRRVTNGIWNETRPAWAPDGRLIAFQADRDPPVGNQEIYVVAPDGTGLRRLTTYPGKDDFPAWAPDGHSLAFARGPSSGTHEIYSMNPEGGAVRQLTLPKLEEVAFLWTPIRPVAGRAFEIVLGAAEVSGADIGILRVNCTARVGKTLLRVATRRFVEQSGRATCTWKLPGNVAGKVLKGTVSAASPAYVVSRRFSFAIRR
jgi:dipeptidyl aminopeptidase/acylaminoacyl peptidase